MNSDKEKIYLNSDTFLFMCSVALLLGNIVADILVFWKPERCPVLLCSPGRQTFSVTG